MTADTLSIVNTLGQIVSAILAICALIYSNRMFKRSITVSHYGNFDHMYSELLKLAIEKPFLRFPDSARKPEEQPHYESYAHLAWCFVESVYDHARDNNELFRTWRSAMEIETQLHRDWFDRPDNDYKFKAEFRKYIADNFPCKTVP